MWLVFAFASALFAGLGTVLSKVDKDGIDSDVANAVRFSVIFLLSWIVPFATGSVWTITSVDPTAFFFLILSGFATGGSWLFYFKALSIGDVSRVAPVDKSSVVMSILLAAIFIPGEGFTVIKVICMVVISVGTFLMFPKGDEKRSKSNRWVVFALLSALCAALTSTLSKMGGVPTIDPDLGTAVRATIMLPMAWMIPAVSRKFGEFKNIKARALVFTLASGIFTCLSWIVYYRALIDGAAGVVTPIEKLNMVISVVLSYFIFKEKITKRFATGIILITLGTFALVL